MGQILINYSVSYEKSEDKMNFSEYIKKRLLLARVILFSVVAAFIVLISVLSYIIIITPPNGSVAIFTIQLISTAIFISTLALIYAAYSVAVSIELAFGEEEKCEEGEKESETAPQKD